MRIVALFLLFALAIGCSGTGDPSASGGEKEAPKLKEDPAAWKKGASYIQNNVRIDYKEKYVNARETYPVVQGPNGPYAKLVLVYDSTVMSFRVHNQGTAKIIALRTTQRYAIPDSDQIFSFPYDVLKKGDTPINPGEKREILVPAKKRFPGKDYTGGIRGAEWEAIVEERQPQ